MNMRRIIISTTLLLCGFGAQAQEICNNGRDDDGNGLVDLNDPACACSVMVQPVSVSSYIKNPSFEDRDTTWIVLPDTTIAYVQCPFGFSTPIQNWLETLQDWNQATSATSDFFHMCGFAPPTFPMPPPDGEGAIGFISTTDYMEYVGTCIFDHPLHPGTDYTLSMWTAGLSISSTNYNGVPWNMGVFYEGNFPLTLYGRTNCVPMPFVALGNGCVGDVPGWIELARVEFQPSNGWIHVSMTFDVPQEIRMITIGAPCDLPASFTPTWGTVDDPVQGLIPMQYYPYTMVDDLMLTEAQDQVLLPLTSTGSECLGNIVVTGHPPVGATNFQWYLDGVAIVGETGTVLNASARGLGGGVYALTSDYQGECLMGNIQVWEAALPGASFLVSPGSGCTPLTVSFRDTTGRGTTHLGWDFGDGSTGTGVSVTHTYTTPGSYDVTLRVLTAEGCTTSHELTAAVVVWPGVSGSISASPNPTDVEQTTVELSGSGSTGDIITWWWDLGAVPPHVSSDETLTVDFPGEPGSYPVTLVVRNAHGCADTVRSVVTVLLHGEIEMPNVFSPDGDGHNDRFIPLAYTGAAGAMEIYNRWGQLLFSTTTLASGWNGRSDGGEVPAGTYYYRVIPVEGEVRSGHVTLLR